MADIQDIQGSKEKVQREIDEIAPLLIECSDWMADNPEIGLQEYQASARLAGMLEESDPPNLAAALEDATKSRTA